MKIKVTFLVTMMVLAALAPLLVAQQINLSEKDPPGGLKPPTDNTLTTFPFYDNVEDSVQSVAWWTGDPAKWQISRLGAHGGIRTWACNATTSSYSYLTITSAFNFTTATNPFLSFWIMGYQGGYFYTKVEVSINGGTTWIEILDKYNYQINQWIRYQVSLQNYQTNNVLIRFKVNTGSGSSVLLLDDIRIDNAPTPGNVALSLPSNNGMKVTWSQSTATDFSKYRIIFSTSQNTVSDWDYAVGNMVTGRTETRVIDISNKTTLQYVFTDLTFTNMHYWVKVYEQDTQELFNQGTNTYDLYTTFTVTPQNAPFVQTFEGTYKWAADAPWAVTIEDAALPGHSPTHAYEDSPGENYPANADRWLVLQANCNTMTHPVLKFNHRYSFDQNTGDYGEIAYSYDNTTWSSLGWFSGYYLDNFQPEEFDLSPLHGQSPVYLRFRTTSSSSVNFDGWHLDDVEIANKTYTNNFPFADDVEDSLLTHQKWVQGNWKTTGGGHSGLWAWQCKPILGYQYSYLNFSGPINLSASTNPNLQLWVKAQNYDFSVRPEVSLDGGSTWNLLTNFSVSSSNMWTSLQWSLVNYVQSSVLIRVGVTKYTTASNATCLIDDFLIDNAPTPGWFTLINPTNNGMKASWQISTATDFSKYRLIISTSSSETNTWDKTVGTTVSGRTETRVIDITDINTAQMTFSDLVFTNMRYYAKLYAMDTQNLWNQGTEVSENFTTFTVTTQNAPFVQDFEGTYQWAADIPWAVTEADAGFPGHSPTHGYEDSPSGIYPANADRWLVMRANCSALTHPVLKFNHRYFFETSYDYGELAYSIDNVSWTLLGRFAGNMLTSYQQEEYDLSFLRGQNPVYIKFKTYSNSSEHRDGWRMDDVEIYNNTRTIPFPFYDDVENDSITHLNWLQGIWRTAAGGHGGLTSWKYNWPASSNNLYSDYYAYLALAGPINLSSASNPELSFWYRVPSSTSDYRIQASTDGGTTWTTISSGNFSGTTWSKKTVSLSSYKLPLVMLRIGFNAYYSSTTNIDDIMINEVLAAPILVTPANNASSVAMPVSFDWNNTPGATKYYLQVATNNTFTSGGIVFKDSTLTNSAATVTGLVSGATYYWRVLAINLIDERGPWSGSWLFSTGSATNDAITLNAGWNLISFDVTLNPNTPADVFAPLITANNLVTVTGFQNQQGKYYLPPPAPPYLNTLQQLIDGEGYWVKVNTAANLSVQGQEIPDNMVINLLTGWNLIAWWCNDTDVTVAFAGLISQGKLVMVTGFEQGGKIFDPNGQPWLNTLSTLKNGFGYWVKVNSNCTLTCP